MRIRLCIHKALGPSALSTDPSADAAQLVRAIKLSDDGGPFGFVPADHIFVSTDAVVGPVLMIVTAFKAPLMVALRVTEGVVIFTLLFSFREGQRKPSVHARQL